jgi:hypothetical protein
MKTKSKYRAIIRPDGTFVDGFVDENNEPIDQGTSTTYYPDDHEIIEDSDKEAMKTKIKEKKLAIEGEKS